LMLTVSGLLLNNTYRPLIKEKSQNHYVWASRLFGGLFLVGSAIVATQFDNILEILKFIWEFFVIFAAAFWLGLKWRRANRSGAWASISITLLGFYLLPLLVPMLFSGLRTNTALLLHTQPQPIERTYTARLMDVEERNAEMAAWEELTVAERSVTEKPVLIVEGEKFSKKYTNPAKPIFWSKAPKVNSKQQLQARGYLFPELLLIHYSGFDLSKTSYAFNETLRMLIRLIIPFLILILVSLFTKPDQDEIIEQFFIKMRTKVRGLGHEVDAKDVEQAMGNPEGTTRVLLFPKSSLELYKWGKQDIVGFLISVGIVFIVIGTLFVLINLGK
jgi:solute:Na+ symporter, SSS family